MGFFISLSIALIVGIVGMLATWTLKPIFDAHYYPLLEKYKIKFKRDDVKGDGEEKRDANS